MTRFEDKLRNLLANYSNVNSNYELAESLVSVACQIYWDEAPETTTKKEAKETFRQFVEQGFRQAA